MKKSKIALLSLGMYLAFQTSIASAQSLFPEYTKNCFMEIGKYSPHKMITINVTRISSIENEDGRVQLFMTGQSSASFHLRFVFKNTAEGENFKNSILSKVNECYKAYDSK